jgi:RNA polymerase sigma factor (TIGR02999 family)
MTPQDITELLLAERDGDPDALERLMPLVYPELRRIAHRQLAGHQRGAMLGTTALVHEVYLKLVDQTRVKAVDRAHFFALAARTMRHIVVDFARRRGSQKRGGGERRVSLEGVRVPVDRQPELVLEIDRALDQLGELSPQLARVFECKYFLGLSEQETAEALTLSLRTVQRDWSKSKAWLRAELGSVRAPRES